METLESTKLKPKWMAIEINDGGKVLSTGADPDKVVAKAEETGKKFILQYVPDPRGKYIF